MTEMDSELMHSDVVRKDMAQLRLEPNLKGYDELRKTFKWTDADKFVEWFPGGKINSAYNVIDRHALGERKDKVALIYDDGEGHVQKYTLRQLYE